MASRDITDTAKQIVLAHGPSNALEFTAELIANWTGLLEDELLPEHPLYVEVQKQAKRVYHFFGYLAVGESES